MQPIGEIGRSCTRAHQCTPKHNPALPLQSHPPLPLKTTPHTQHRNTSTRNPSPQSSSKQLTRRIAARQPSIRSKPQRRKRDLHKMLHVGETSRPCTRASECTPTHSLSSPQPQHAPASSKQYQTTTNHNSNTSPRNRIPQSTFETLTCRIAARQPSVQFSFIYWSRGVSHDD